MLTPLERVRAEAVRRTWRAGLVGLSMLLAAALGGLLALT